MLANRRVLITGAHGSIGSEIVCELLRNNPHQEVVCLAHSEEGILKLTHKLEARFPNADVTFLYGDIRDAERMNEVMRGVDVVFHAAAMKHVGYCEWDVWETVKTNVIGTHNLITAAVSNDIETFVGVSTDKAAEPSSVLGLTKALMERMVIAKNLAREQTRTRFYCVRFGNVIGSSGSVYPLFKHEIRTKNTVSVTGIDMIRYCMTIPDAVKLVFTTYEMAHGGEIFVLKMPKLRIYDLARAMAKRFGNEATKVQFIEPRYGEKTTEKLVSELEMDYCYNLGTMYVIFPQSAFKKNPYRNNEKRWTEPQNVMNEQEINELIDRIEAQT